MDKKRNSGGQRARHLGKIKLAITAGAVTMTLGFWTLFSQQADQQAVQAAQAPQISVDQSGANPFAGNTNDNTAVTQPNQNFRFFLGGSRPVPSRPRTITSTRSSR